MKKRNVIIIASVAVVVLLIAGLIIWISSNRQPETPTEPTGETSSIIVTAPPVETTEPTEPPTEPQYDAAVGQVFEILKLATNVNGENGVTYYYTNDGVNLTPFDEWHGGDGKWIHGDAGVLFYPALAPTDNYTAAGTSAEEYVAMSYEIPETGAVELFSWTVLQGDPGKHGYRVKIAMGTPNNMLHQYDVEGGSQTLVYKTYGLKVTKGEKLYLIFEPLVKKDNEWFGFKASLTYTGLGEDAVPTNPDNEGTEYHEPETEPEPTDPVIVKFTDIVGKNNGTNGLTFYRTSDGKQLTALTRWDASEGKWWHGDKGVLVYPKYDAKENYGIFGSSSDEYIVMGYKLPATGKIDLLTWAVLQSGHDYRVKIAKGSPTNVVKTMDVKGDSQTHNSINIQLDVIRGDVLYIHYEPLEPADGAWGGYKTQLTYIEGGKEFKAFDPKGIIPPDTSAEKAGPVIRYADLASDINGANNLTYYYTSDGKLLTKFTESIGSGTDFRWVHGTDGVLVYPALSPADNYGLIGTSASQYTAAGYKVPATGTVELFSALTLQSGHDYQVRIAKGTPENVLYIYNVTGASQTTVEKTFTINVDKGQALYLLYKPLEVANGAWAGFKTALTYVSEGTQIGPADPKPIDPDPEPDPAYAVDLGDTFKAAEIIAKTSEANAAGPATIYYTNDRKNLTAFTTFDPDVNNGRWYHHDSTNTLSWTDPFVDVAANYGWIGMSATESIAMSYKMPEKGTIDLYNWLALHNGKDIKIYIAKGTPENVVDTLTVSGGIDAIGERTTALNVDKGEMVYVIYRLLEGTANPDNNYAGYKTHYTYTAVGIHASPEPNPDHNPEPDPDPDPGVTVGAAINFSSLAGDTNGANGLSFGYTADGVNVTPYTLYDAGQGRWYEVTNGAVTFFDPCEVVADNYGLGQTSSYNYLVMTYEAPTTGTIDLYTWLVTQAGTGHGLTVAKSSLDNVVGTYSTAQGEVKYQSYTLVVTKGEKLYLIFKPTVAADWEWFGYKASVTYTALD